jgi:hypothetical protein
MGEPRDPFRPEHEQADFSAFYLMFIGLVAAGFTEDQALTLIAKMIRHGPQMEVPPSHER